MNKHPFKGEEGGKRASNIFSCFMLQKISQGDLWQYGPLYVSGDFNFITVFLFFLCFSVGPKISEMSPSAKDKIREDVQDAMAEKKDGKWQKFFMSFTCLKHDFILIRRLASFY